MSVTSFYNPVRLLMGEGCLSQLGEQAASWGRRALLVTGRSALQAAGHLQRAQELLTNAGLEVIRWEGARPNPTDAGVLAAAAVAREADCDLVVGLGGGSAMDTAKAAAVAATHDRPLADFLLPGPDGRKAVPTAATLPIICVTSTAGTSSQLTPFSIISLERERVKSSLGGDALYPRVAISDPELTYSVPPRVTAATGVDVLCHAVEAYYSTGASPITDATGERAVELVGRYLARAVADGQDREARRALSEADVFAGFPLSNCGGTVIHALEHPLSAHYPDLPHGEGLAAMLPAYARRFSTQAPERFARLAELLGAPVAGLSPAQAAARLAPALEDLLERVGLRVSLTDLGVAAEALEAVVQDALRYNQGTLARMPVPVGEAELRALLEESR